MAHSLNGLAERERRRWMKPNAHLWIRPDADRFMRPDAERFLHPSQRGQKPWYEAPEYMSPAMRAYANPTASLRVAEADKAERRAFAAELQRLRSNHAELQRWISAQRHTLALRQWARKAGYDPNQPRVPTGNPDGGQWTDNGGSGGGGRNDPRVLSDATPDNEWIPGARYAQNDPQKPKRDRAEGHHYVPRALYKDLPLPPETRKVFDEATTGRLHVVGHRWDEYHRRYSEAVRELRDKYLIENMIRPEVMTPDQARSLINEVEHSREPRIRNYLFGIRFREYLYRLRIGRGRE